MPAKNHLTSEQKEKLQKALKREENGNIRERILILLLLNDGKTQQDIAEFVGCAAATSCGVSISALSSVGFSLASKAFWLSLSSDSPTVGFARTTEDSYFSCPSQASH